MNIAAQRNYFLIFSGAVLMATVAIAAYWQTAALLFLPVALMLVLYLFQQPTAALYLLVLSIPWSVEYSFSQNFGTDLPDELLMLIAAYISLALLIYKRRQLVNINIHPLLLLLLLQFCWLLVPVVLSSHPLISFKFLLAKSWYLLAFVVLPLLVLKDMQKIKNAGIIICASMLTVMVVVLVRHAQFAWDFENVNAAISPFFRNHVNYSALLICIFPLLVVFIKNTSGARKGFLISLLIITLFAVYLSYARGAWLALFVGLLGYWLLKKKLLLPAFVLSLILLISSVLFLRQNDRYLRFAPDYKSTVFHTDFTEHMAATYSMQDLSTAERYYRWIAGIKMVADSWLTGFGPNTFYNNYKSYTAPAFKTWVSKNEEHSTVHNYFLLLLAEQGVIALLLFLMTLGSFFWYAQKIYARTEDVFWKAAVAVVAVIVCMIATVNMLSDLIETDKVGSMFYLCIAVLIIADLKTKELLKNTVAQSAE